MLSFSLDDGVRILQRTPVLLNAMLRGLPDSWTRANEGPDTWSPFDIVGHLVHGEETDWIARARIILEHGESRPFEPFDRFAQFEKYGDRTLEELLDLFTDCRRKSLETLQGMSILPDRLELSGTHPAFGRVTLRQLLATWVAHDLSHIAQIARVMSRQYREEVGPWKEYLPILTR